MLLVFGLIAALPALASGPVLSARIDHYALAHQRAEKVLREFDRELDQAVLAGRGDVLQRSSAYRQLQALRELKHADAEAIGEQLEELQSSGSPAAAEAVRAMQAKLNSLNNSDRAAALFLFDEISRHDASLEGIILEKFSALLQPRTEMGAERKPQLSLMPSLLDLEMAEITADMDFSEGIDLSSQKVPAKVRPGTGPEGNLTGRNFPLNTWALTFDDGPSAKYTKQVVDMLQGHGKKASFFWLAQNVSANKSIISYARSAGMSLNNHSYSHPDLSKASAEKLQHEIGESTDLEARLYGSHPEFFRCPYGAGVNSRNVRQLIADNNMIHVFWNVDSLDWQDKDPQSVLARVKKAMSIEKRGIILFHDIHPQSLAAAKLLMEYSATLDNTKQALRWVTMPEIRDELNRK